MVETEMRFLTEPTDQFIVEIKNKKTIGGNYKLHYTYDKSVISKQLTFLNTSKLELKNQLKSLLVITNEWFLDYYIITNENTGKTLTGNINYIFDNFNLFVGNQYTYLYENKQHTTTFSNDSLLKCIEIMNILNGVITLINPFIKIVSMKEMCNDIKHNIETTNEPFTFLGTEYKKIGDKIKFMSNYKTIIWLYNNRKLYRSNTDYYEIFKKIVVI